MLIIAIDLSIYCYIQFGAYMFSLVIQIIEDEAIELGAWLHICQFCAYIKLRHIKLFINFTQGKVLIVDKPVIALNKKTLHIGLEKEKKR